MITINNQISQQSKLCILGVQTGKTVSRSEMIESLKEVEFFKAADISQCNNEELTKLIKELQFNNN